MPASLPFSTRIDQDSFSQSVQYRRLVAQFADGYQQIAPDGINNKVISIQAMIRCLNATDLGTWATAVDAAAGVDYFTWTPPGLSGTYKWQITQWSSKSNNQYYDVAFTLTQYFG